MPAEILVIVLPVPRDDNDLPRAHLPQDILRRRRRAAAAEDERLFAAHLRAAGLYQHGKAVSVRVAAPERSVRPADDGVDCTDGAGCVRQLRAVGDDRFFIRDRHIQTVKFPGAQKALQLLRLLFI